MTLPSALPDCGQVKRPFLQPLGTNPESASVPDEDLQPIALAVAELEQVPAQRLTRQSIPDQTLQPFEPLVHVGEPSDQIDPCSWAQSKHGLRPLEDSHQAFERTRIKIWMHLDIAPARWHCCQPTTWFVLLRRFPGRQLHRHQTTGQGKLLAKLAPPLTAVYKLGHQLMNFRTGTSLERWQLSFCGHPDTSTQPPPVEKAWWPDAYPSRDIRNLG